jgi:pSer/pThr/pTyr-binding forkhead associated (FHA) protein
MDVGLVCDGCRTFNPMGARTCKRCGSGLSLDGQGGSAALARAAMASAQPSGAAKPHAIGSSGGAAPGAPKRTCAVCGAELKPGFRFCGACGTPAEEQTQPSRLTPIAQASSPSPQTGGRLGRSAPSGQSGKKTLFFSTMQAARAKLVLIKGDGLDGVSYTLAGEEHQAGRGENVPLPFAEDPFMSPVHANFFYRSGKLVVRDEDSTNGVYMRIRGSVPIELGDRFLVGEQVLEVEPAHGPNDGMKPSEDGTYFYASPQPPSRFRIIQVLRGGDTGLAHQALSDVVSLGREGNDINFPDDPFISGHHAQVSTDASDGGKLALTDLGSKNGTFLRLSRESVLEHGDYVFMGQQLLRVEIV